MSKAILIVDIDDKYSNSIDELRAEIKVNCYGEEIVVLKNETLKPLPHNDFIHEAEGYETEEEYKAYVCGWNDCLETLLGEEE